MAFAFRGLAAALSFLATAALAQTPQNPAPEVRGTWLTTTANTHIATPADSAETMRRLREIGLNTVYVETWKNGYTQFPSLVLERTVGVDRRPALAKSDPSDDPAKIAQPGRDLLGETLIAAHRNGLAYIAWFEYGFMAAHKDTDNHLRRMYPNWLSKDINGNVVAPNGFVWMNPLHPDARRFLLDLVIEAIDKYDLDGVQLDDRIVWPYITMGYDDYTKKIYAEEHNGAEPPADHTDEAWRRWRAEKVNEYSKKFVQEIRARRPGLRISLSPAPYPWSYENYCLEWPKWASWTSADALSVGPNWPGEGLTPRWDEFIPQCYRYNFPAFKGTWDQQVEMLTRYGAADRVKDMLAGVLTTGSEPNPVPWSDLSQAIAHVRSTGGGGHVWWFSRGVLDVYPSEVTALYDIAAKGWMPNPNFPPDWRPAPIVLESRGGGWVGRAKPGTYRVIGRENGVWQDAGGLVVPAEGVEADGLAPVECGLPRPWESVELLVDRRPDLSRVTGM